MRTDSVGRQITVLGIFAASAGLLSAQPANCADVPTFVRMANAKSASILREEDGKIGKSYRSQVIFAGRWFELHSNDRTAALALLNLIPNGDEQQETWITLGSSLCDSESYSDMKSLGQLRDRLAHDLARAVLLAPEKLRDYLGYALVSTQDPHSDYAVRMEAVCRAKPKEFGSAISALPPEKREWLLRLVFNPEGCHALKLPEGN